MTRTFTPPRSLAPRLRMACLLSLTLLVLLGAARAGLAAPEPEPELTASTERERIQALIDLGIDKRDAGENEEALRLWEQAYQRSPEDDRRLLRPSLAQLHLELYSSTGAIESLRRAHELNLEQFEGVDPSDVAALELAEEAVAETERELERIAAEQAQREQAAREQAEAELQARAEAAAAEAARERELREHEQRLADQARALQLAQTRRDRRLLIVGGSLTGLGLAGTGAMAASLGVAGQRYAELREAYFPEGEFLGDYSSDQVQKFEQLERQHRSARGAAIAAGVSGGALLVTGVALLLPPLQRRSRARLDVRASAQGLALHF